MASSNVMVIIRGTLSHLSLFGQRSPGTSDPCSEQKQSGSLQMSLSHGGAALGSLSTSQAFSSEPSVQSFLPSQKRSLFIQIESPQASLFTSQRGSSVLNRGFTFFSLVSLSQFLTAHFQSQVCFSRSKARPGGHLIACKPAAVHWMTSLQLSSPELSLNSSPALLSSHRSFSWICCSSSWQTAPEMKSVATATNNQFIFVLSPRGI